MSRKIITMVVVGLLLAALSAAEQILVMKITDGALEQTREIMREIRAGNLNAAQEKAHALDETWDRQASVLETMVDHGATDDVRYALSKMLGAMESGDRAAALIYAGELEGGVEHVLERQEVTVQNIL